MKQLILTIACLLSFLGQAKAQETPINQFWSQQIGEIKPNTTVSIKIRFTPDEAVYASFSFDLWLPKGIDIVDEVTQTWDELEEQYVTTTKSAITMSTTMKDLFNEPIIEKNDEDIYNRFFFKVIAKDATKVIPTTSNVIMAVTLTVDDMIPTGDLGIKIGRQTIAHKSGASNLGLRPDDYEVDATGQIDVIVTDAGYATFSWPRTLDFSQTGLNVYRAAVLAELDNDYGKMTTALIENGIVAANEGVLLKGNAGTYNPATTEDTPTSADNFFIGTAGGEVIPTAEQHYYVFARKQNGDTGFYKVMTDVPIPQYKAYLNLKGVFSRITFDLAEEATGIRDLQNGSTDELYDLRGVKMNSQKQRKGVYIQNGKKVVIK